MPNATPAGLSAPSIASRAGEQGRPPPGVAASHQPSPHRSLLDQAGHSFGFLLQGGPPMTASSAPVCLEPSWSTSTGPPSRWSIASDRGSSAPSRVEHSPHQAPATVRSERDIGLGWFWTYTIADRCAPRRGQEGRVDGILVRGEDAGGSRLPRLGSVHDSFCTPQRPVAYRHRCAIISRATRNLILGASCGVCPLLCPLPER